MEKGIAIDWPTNRLSGSAGMPLWYKWQPAWARISFIRPIRINFTLGRHVFNDTSANSYLSKARPTCVDWIFGRPVFYRHSASLCIMYSNQPGCAFHWSGWPVIIEYSGDSCLSKIWPAGIYWILSQPVFIRHLACLWILYGYLQVGWYKCWYITFTGRPTLYQDWPGRPLMTLQDTN